MTDFSKVQFLEIIELADGQRLDNFLIRQLKGLPKSRLYRLIRKGEVRLNKKRCKPDDRLSTGDIVRLPPIRLGVRAAPAQPSDQLSNLLKERIIFASEDYLVINKPAGISVHGGSGVRLGLIEALRQLQPDWRSLELVHRLDRDTSGCLLVAKNPIYLKYLHNQLKLNNVQKHYLALVHGYWPDTLIEVDAPLIKNQLLSGERVVRVSDSGKSAMTKFKVLERFGRIASLVEAMPITGRTHQIRVHCQIAGHPIAGDPKYESLGKTVTKLKSDKLCLHAAKIRFKSATEDSYLQYEAELNPYFTELLNTLRAQSKTS